MTISGTRPSSEVGPGRGVVLRDPVPWPDLRMIVEMVEQTGYDAVFVPEISAREAFSTLTGFALCTTRLRLGTGVVAVWSRDPATTAMGAATIHDLSGGRLILGLGAGTMPPGRQHLSGASIIEVVGDYFRLVQQILSGHPVSPDDRFARAGFELGFDLRTGPPPVWLGALGDRMIELAGRVADGVILNWCTPERVAEAVTLVARGAEKAGRDPGAVTVSVYVRACLGVEDDVALEALKPMAGQYAAIPHYLRQFERMGLGEGAAAAAKAHAAGRPDGVPADFVRAVAVTGGRREATARFEAFGEAGADLVLLYPVAALEPFSSLLGTILAAAPSPAVER